MNKLIDRLHYAMKHIAFEAHRENALQVMSEAVLAIEAADRMASQLDILVREGNCTLEDQEALTAYRTATQGRMMVDVIHAELTTCPMCARQYASAPSGYIHKCGFCGCIMNGGTPATQIPTIDVEQATVDRIVAWLKRENELCDCHARNESECLCGAWFGSKEMYLENIWTAIQRGEWKR